MVSKILNPIDGSPASLKAADYAISLSSKFKADLLVIHVVHDPMFVNMSSFGIYEIETPGDRKEIIHNIREKTRQWLDNIQLMASEKNIALTKTKIIGTSSSVVAAIEDYSEKNNIDMVVIGTKGHSRIRKLLLGSVASGVVTHAHCPVLVVK
jgi:nucleotide-binding universal stress UspA family protein